MKHEQLTVRYDRGRLVAEIGFSLLLIAAVWLWPLFDGGYPFAGASGKVSDGFWPVAALATPVALYFAGDMLFRVIRRQPGVSYDASGISSAATGTIPLGSIKLVRWNGKPKGRWPGSNIEIVTETGRTRKISVTILLEEDADQASEIVSKFPSV